MDLYFTAALFTIVKIWKRSKCPSIDEWIKKMWYIYTKSLFFFYFNWRLIAVYCHPAYLTYMQSTS